MIRSQKSPANLTFLFGLGMWLTCGFATAQDDLGQREQEAFQQAVATVAPSVVRIETVGGLERVGNVLLGTGPTTGLVLTADGYIISSAFNFAAKPTSILVTLPGGERVPARLVATDHNRMLTLLRIEVDEPLVEPKFVPPSDLQVGQWTIAVGRTFEADRPSMSVGIISALARVWGKAIQTDAKVSPNNYGGPLIDIQGRVLGVLVPLSPDSSSDVAGVQWYDSGIGFAIPYEHVRTILPRLEEGEDLYTGILGVSLRGRNQFADPPIVAAARINSPAYHAGIQAGDRIVEIDGASTKTLISLRARLRQHYAGDTIRVAVQRGDERIESDVELVARLEPYEHPFLGILPMRIAGDETPGVPLRYVYPESAAAGAGLEPGDRLIALGGEAIADREDLLEKLAALSRGETAQITIQRGESSSQHQLRLGSLPESLPAELPSPRERTSTQFDDRPQVGTHTLRLPEFSNTCLVHVPEQYDPQVAYGLVVWLHPPGGFKDDELAARWKSLCTQYDLILVAPKSADPAKWLPTEIQFIRKAVDDVRATYNVDSTRIVAHGYQSGGIMATILAFADRDTIRAVAAVDAPMATRPGDNDPLQRLAFYIAAADGARMAKPIAAGVERLRLKKFPVTVKKLGEPGRYLTDEELLELVRWIDTLDRA